jgi:hypothetical protein
MYNKENVILYTKLQFNGMFKLAGLTARAPLCGAYSFSRGEAGSKIGTSEPILLTDVECGQKPHKTVLFTDFLKVKSFKKSIPCGATYRVSPNSTSDLAGARPPSPREKVGRLRRQSPR